MLLLMAQGPCLGQEELSLDHAVADGPWLGEMSWRISTVTMPKKELST